MNWKISLFSLSFVFASVFSAALDVGPCAIDDTECLTKLTQRMYSLIVNGNEELGIPPSDPQHNDLIEGNLDTLKYILSDSDLTGFSKCEVKKVTITSDRNNGEINMYCPNLEINGHYVVDGNLLGFPIKGEGPYKIDTRDYDVTVTSELKYIKENDGKTYLAFKNFKPNADLKGGFNFELGNLFDGNPDTGKAFNDMINQNWQLVAKLMQGPIVDTGVSTVLKNCNKFLKSEPVESLLKL